MHTVFVFNNLSPLREYFTLNIHVLTIHKINEEPCKRPHAVT